MISARLLSLLEDSSETSPLSLSEYFFSRYFNVWHDFDENQSQLFSLFGCQFNTNMSRYKTIGTIFASLAIGALSFVLASPKKVQKKREATAAETKEENSYGVDNELFI